MEVQILSGRLFWRHSSMVEHTVVNREVARSVLAGVVCRLAVVVFGWQHLYQDSQPFLEASSSGQGHPVLNRTTGVQFSVPLPYRRRPIGWAPGF